MYSLLGSALSRIESEILKLPDFITPKIEIVISHLLFFSGYFLWMPCRIPKFAGYLR